MLIELVALGVGAAYTTYNMNKSLKMDDQTLKNYAEAFEKSGQAFDMVWEKRNYAEIRLGNVVKKKKGIISNSVPKFVEVYKKIQRVKIESSDCIEEIAWNRTIDDFKLVSAYEISRNKDFSDVVLITGVLFKGIPGMIKMDSERKLAASNNQLSMANLQYEQAKQVCIVYDAIVSQADRISDLLARMNILFLKVIEQTERTIEENGYNVKNYTDYDKGILMTCVNVALALSDLINIPVIDENGVISKEAKRMLQVGEQSLKEMSRLLS